MSSRSTQIIGGGAREHAHVDGPTNSLQVKVTANDANPTNAISTTSFNSRDAATLAADAVFQGVGEDVSAYGRAGISIKSDNATDGVLTIETSHDGVTWGGPTRNWANTSIASPHMWNIVEQYFRIKYTNGTTEATNLSIQVQYSVNADTVLGHQLDEILQPEVEAQVIRPGTSFDLDTARQHIMGQKASFFFGYNGAVTSTWTDIHPGGGDINWQTAAQSIEIVSTHVDDNGTTPGPGVHSVEVHGLSATGEDQDEVILTNGTAAVAGTLTYTRVNKVHSELVGTYGGSHRGDITCQVAGGGAMLSVMKGLEGAVNSTVQYGSGEAGNGYWSVPLGKVMYITRLGVVPDVSGNKTVDVVLYERDSLLDVTTPFVPRRILWEESAATESISKEFKSHLKIKSLADIWFRARSSGTSAVAVSLDFYLVDADSEGA